MKDLWNQILSEIKPKISGFEYEAWLSDTSLKSYDADKFILIVNLKNDLQKNCIINDYHNLLVEIGSTIINEKISIEYIPTDSSNDKNSSSNTSNHKKNKPVTNKTKISPEIEGLNQNFSFDNFVVGSSNNFAFTAALSVAENPCSYNPLFIYSSPGLGKTHLLNAIGLKINEKNSKKKIIYVQCEQFMDELINHALKNRKINQFREKYRNNCDVLLLDDIQILTKATQTQIEFFHTFDYLYRHFKQIVLTSDKLPQDLKELDDRLKSRFSCGLITDIEVPEFETRVAILAKKAELANKYIPNEVLFYIANHAKENVRELEMYLNTLLFKANMSKVNINIDFAKKALELFVAQRKKYINFDTILDLVSNFGKINKKDIMSKKRNKPIVNIRYILMYLLQKHLNLTYSDIGEKLGGKHHTSVMYGIDKINETLNNDLQLSNLVEKIEKNLQ